MIPQRNGIALRHLHIEQRSIQVRGADRLRIGRAFRDQPGHAAIPVVDGPAIHQSRALLLGRIIGAVFGIVIAVRIARAYFPEPSPDYRTDPARCVSCTRCFAACPYELVRRGIPIELPQEGGRSA